MRPLYENSINKTVETLYILQLLLGIQTDKKVQKSLYLFIGIIF